ncbi:MAG: HAD superfamily hydrolase (TIGR01549 family) [Bacteriovoracaceae bacterium]|jgi:HAD superfamily hydrolase (TIGR01549 family)
MKKLEGIIFDLDSTLVDVDLDFNAIKDALNIPRALPILEHLETLTDSKEKQRKEKILLEFELEAARNFKAIPHVKELLLLLKEKEIKMAVLTRNCKAAADLELQGIKDFFDPIFTREDHKDCKPLPGGILGTCKKWKVDAASVIMTGDYLYDLQAGQAAGSKTIWFDNPKYKGRDFSKDADYSLSSWSEMITKFEFITNHLGFN